MILQILGIAVGCVIGTYLGVKVMGSIWRSQRHYTYENLEDDWFDALESARQASAVPHYIDGGDLDAFGADSAFYIEHVESEKGERIV